MEINSQWSCSLKHPLALMNLKISFKFKFIMKLPESVYFSPVTARSFISVWLEMSILQIFASRTTLTKKPTFRKEKNLHIGRLGSHLLAHQKSRCCDALGF